MQQAAAAAMRRCDNATELDTNSYGSTLPTANATITEGFLCYVWGGVQVFVLLHTTIGYISAG